MIKNMDVNAPVSDNLIILTDASFKKQIKSGVTLVDFWAAWCMPCKVLGPIVSEVADELGDKAAICKLNIDENKKTSAELGIRSIPTIIIFKDGKIVKKIVGVKSKGVIIKAVKEHLG
ncbi:MAG: thioredoxin [Bacteroidota bacterium]